MENRIGGAYLIYNGVIVTDEFGFRPPDWCSVFQAKTHSIGLALDKLIEMNVKRKNIAIVCNDENVLHSMNNFYNDQPRSVQIREAIQLLYDSDNRIELCYLEAQYREDDRLFSQADRLAREASELEEITVELEMTLRKAKKLIKDELFACWQSELPGLVSSWTANFVLVEGLSQLVDFYTAQFITAHGSFGEYRERFKLSLYHGCVCCGSEEDNPEHVLFVCEYYDRQRRALLHSNGIRRREDLVKLKPNNPTAIKDFKQFCKFVVQHRQKIPDE